MMKLILGAAGIVGVAVSLAAVPAPALAQAGQFTLVVYGNDPCPREAICIRKKESDSSRMIRKCQYAAQPSFMIFVCI